MMYHKITGKSIYSNLFRSTIKGSIINWSNAKWEVSGMRKFETTYSNICQPTNLGLVLVPGAWNIQEANKLCQNFGGDINVINSYANNAEVAKATKSSRFCSELGKI